MFDMRLSVLLPSRGRPEKAERAVDSLLCSLAEPERCEVLVRLDRDDELAIETRRRLLEFPNTTVHIGHPRQGYYSFHEFVDELCALSSGRWLFLYNDDIKFLSDTEDQKGWEVDLDHFDHESIILAAPVCIEFPTYPSFPIIPRRVYEVLGHWSFHPACDSWMLETIVRSGVGPAKVLRGRLSHERADFEPHSQLRDETFTRSQKALYEGGIKESFWDPHYRNLRKADSWKLLEYAKDHCESKISNREEPVNS